MRKLLSSLAVSGTVTLGMVALAPASFAVTSNRGAAGTQIYHTSSFPLNKAGTGSPATPVASGSDDSTSAAEDSNLFLIGGAAVLAAGVIGFGLNISKVERVKVDADKHKVKTRRR